MATVGPYPGLRGEVGMSSVAWTSGTTVSGMTFNNVERVNDPGIDNTQDTADSRSNDSGGEAEHVNTWRSGGADFEFIADVGAAQQAALWAYYKAGSIVGWRFQPSGNVSGDTMEYFAATIASIKRTGGKGDVAKFSVTLKRTLGITSATI